MDNNQIKELNKYFDNNTKKELVKDIDNEEYKFLYLNKQKYKNYLKNYFDLRYLKEFLEIINDDCINYQKHNKKILIETNGKDNKYKNIDYLEYNDLKLYKVMDGFYTAKEEHEYIKNNFNKPFWFSSWFYALLNLPGRSGGITCFKSKEKANLFVVNCENIKKLINLVRKKEKDKIKYRGSLKTKKYTIEILKLAACSDQGFIDQVKIFSRLNNYGKNLWLNTVFKTGKYSFCNLDDLKKNKSYFALTKSKGKVNYDFAYLLSYINNTYYNNYFDGYLIQAQYTPYETKIGIIPEEVVIFNPYKKFKRDINDKYDWDKYKSKIKFTIPLGLRLQYMLSDHNKNLELFTMYHKKVDSKYNIELSKKYRNDYKIILINCNKFKSINVNDDTKNIIEDYQKLINTFKPDMFIITNTKDNMELSFKNYKMNKINNNLYFYLDQPMDVAIININSNIYKKFLSYKEFKKDKHKTFNNIFKILKNTHENILYINEGLLNINSVDEIELIKEFGYKNLYLKNSFYLSDNFLFVRDIDIIGNHLLDFNKSYFYPQLLVI